MLMLISLDPGLCSRIDAVIERACSIENYQDGGPGSEDADMHVLEMPLGIWTVFSIDNIQGKI